MSDLIDRANLLAEIQLAIEDSGCVNHERDMMDCIRYAPTIDAVPVVHGRWNRIPEDYGRLYTGQCSNCGCEPMRNFAHSPWAYCPNCGALMDGKEGQNG